jgi:hypothetical protein
VWNRRTWVRVPTPTGLQRMDQERHRAIQVCALAATQNHTARTAGARSQGFAATFLRLLTSALMPTKAMTPMVI